jgi:hypothetical protein
MKLTAVPRKTTWTWPQLLLIIWAISILLFRLLLVLLSAQVVTLPREYRDGSYNALGCCGSWNEMAISWGARSTPSDHHNGRLGS